jgi:hypothetical protein
MTFYKKKLLLVFGLLLTLTACSGNYDKTTKEINNITPLVFEASLDNNKAIIASFNEDIFTATVGKNSFAHSKKTNLDGIATFDSFTNITIVRPYSGLETVINHIFTLKSTITNFTRNLLGWHSNGSPDTPQDPWSDPAIIQIDNVIGHDVEAPQIAFDNNGNAIMVWHQTDNSVFSIWANRYDSSTRSWDIAAVIETDNTGHAYNPKIAFDTIGNVIAVWWQHDGSVQSIWANQYDAKTKLWATAAVIQNDDTGDAYNPEISIDASGNAVVVWRQFDGKVNSIWANHFDAKTRMWGTKAELKKDNYEDAYGPQIAVDANGNAVALWNQSNGTVSSIWANQYDATAQLWGTATVIENESLVSAYNPQIAFDASGNAIASWNQSNGKIESRWTNHYDERTSSWSIASPVESDVFITENAQIRVNANSRDITVWTLDVSSISNQ